ncbi:SDR family NAD(P)-dependent oxidoreductase [Catenuloplanes japonicus]|uniref:SDR family NAD(P)-dependent oxidoreductase n=1 Tax=Catenuloplanes japonicus TaxID=33876 RepID=UPI0022B6F9CC|nr:SDR family NAD(P)-dependent oxidoreductase [Catenuloplanes japonicus]
MALATMCGLVSVSSSSRARYSSSLLVRRNRTHPSVARSSRRSAVSSASERGVAVVREIEAAGGTARFARADLADLASVQDLAEAAGPVDVLVNNAQCPCRTRPEPHPPA